MADTSRTVQKPRRWIWVVVGLLLSVLLGGGAFVAERRLSKKSEVQAFERMVMKLQEPVFVLITKDQIYLDGQPVATPRTLASGAAKDWKVASLYRRLQTLRYRHNMVTDEAFHRKVEVCAVEETDFKVLKKVLHTSRLAGFSQQRLGVPEDGVPKQPSRMKSSGCSLTALEPAPSTSGRRFYVQVGAKGFTLQVGRERMAIATKGESLDLARLASTLKTVRRRYPRIKDLTVTSDDGVKLDQILAAVHTTRKAGYKKLALRDASVMSDRGDEGLDHEDALGGLIGDKIGEAYGVGGLGLVGTGRGGSGSGTIGLGTLGTIGKGSGAGYGRGVGRLRGRRGRAPRVVSGHSQVRGALDKEIIRRIIRRHINEVKYCYQKELQAKPDLYGRIIIQFTISPTGQVVMAVVQKSTLNNRNVETCVAKAFRRWLFPKPKGGGIVIVSHPMVLRSAGNP